MGADTVRMDVPELVMVVVDRERSSPDGYEVFVKTMVPVKPSITATDIVEVHEGPGALTLRNSGSAES